MQVNQCLTIGSLIILKLKYISVKYLNPYTYLIAYYQSNMYNHVYSRKIQFPLSR